MTSNQVSLEWQLEKYASNREGAERVFKQVFDGYEEVCSAADRTNGFTESINGRGYSHKQELSTAFGAGFICGVLVARGKKPEALKWLEGKARDAMREA